MLRWANVVSNNTIFSSVGVDINERRNTLRTDLGASLLNDAAANLGLPMRSVMPLLHNPVEWCRGVQAYLEARCHLSTLQNAALTASETEARTIGLRVHNTISSLCNFDNVKKASEVFRTAVKAVRTEIEEQSQNSNEAWIGSACVG